jgi:hypothetical protein
MRVQQQNRPMHDPRLPYQRVKLDITMKLLRGVPWSTDHRGVHDASGSNPGADYKTAVPQRPTLTRGVWIKTRTSR